MTSDLQQQQFQQQQQHISLDIDNKNFSSHEMDNLTDIANNHKNDLHSPTDFDSVDGRIPRIPRAVPETDEDEEYDDRPFSVGPRAGVDDGLLPNDERDVEEQRPSKPPTRRPSFAFPGYNGPGFVTYNGVETQIPDINAYQHKKTLAQGMMDLALLSANANQLRYVLESYERHPYFYPSVIFISISIIFQIAVGVGLILNGKYNIKDENEICRANKVNNYTVIGIFIVTVVNVFISAFGVADPMSESKT